MDGEIDYIDYTDADDYSGMPKTKERGLYA